MSDLLVIPVGGLGRSQLDSIVSALRGVPGVHIAATPLWDAYRETPPVIWNEMARYPGMPIFPIGHSLGAGTARNTANVAIEQGLNVAGLVLLDNIEYNRGPFISKCPNTKVYQAADSWPFNVSPVEGFPATVVPGTSHNSLPHDPGVIAAIVAAVQAAIAALSGTPITLNPGGW